MQLTDLLAPERICCGSRAGSKKRVLEQISGLIAESQEALEKNEVFDSLLSRERLGSTGLGHGVAIPHGRIKGSDKAIGALVTLEHGIDFDAMDNQDVDLLFAVLVPENATDEHLQILAKLAEMFSDAELLERMRKAEDATTLLNEIRNWQTQ